MMVINIIDARYTDKNGWGGNFVMGAEEVGADVEVDSAIDPGGTVEEEEEVMGKDVVVGEGELILIVCVSYSGSREAERRRCGLRACKPGKRSSGSFVDFRSCLISCFGSGAS